MSNDSSNPKDLFGDKKVPNLSAVSPISIIYEALGMQDGVAKYGAYNYRDKKVRAMIYIDACLRHIFDWVDGESNAEDSGKPHIGHAKACLGILADAIENGNLVDDRPKPGVSSKLLERWEKKDLMPSPLQTCHVHGTDVMGCADDCPERGKPWRPPESQL